MRAQIMKMQALLMYLWSAACTPDGRRRALLIRLKPHLACEVQWASTTRHFPSSTGESINIIPSSWITPWDLNRISTFFISSDDIAHVENHIPKSCTRKQSSMYRERDGLEPLIYTNISWMHEDYRKMLSVEHNQRLLTYLYMCIYCLSLLTAFQLTPSY